MITAAGFLIKFGRHGTVEAILMLKAPSKLVKSWFKFVTFGRSETPEMSEEVRWAVAAWDNAELSRSADPTRSQLSSCA